MQVQTGLDRVADYTHLFHGQRIGIMANQTAFSRSGQFIVEVFQDLEDVNVTALFAPEHGLWGTLGAGAEVKTSIHPDYRVPVYSLYGPDENHQDPVLENVDVLVFDMQDIGTRFYTYVSSMALAMKASARLDKRFVVLDRPNPLGGERIEGPILDPNFASFKGLFPIPVVHGLTVGELARLINGEGWLGAGLQVDLEVVPLRGWTRDMDFNQTGLRFIKPSPNMPDVLTALIYPGTALIEGTNVSEGRGSERPFQQFGAPWIDAERLANRLNAHQVPGIRFIPIHFTPQSSKHAGIKCHGTQVELINEDVFMPFACGIHILETLYRLYPNQLVWRVRHLDELCGTDRIRKAIITHSPVKPLIQDWTEENAVFRQKSSVYTLYP
ncbi:exo-beta-N-acetylmuramidase NamZ domain-containing protein [Planctomycetota bacterium]